jgi:T3SS negative regulator,GrlR
MLMTDGIYSITFRGATDWGLGMLVLRSGRLTGADVGGVLYDGRYHEQAGSLIIEAELTVPPGATMVQGVPARPQTYKVPFTALVPQTAIREGTPILINMPPGPVNVIIKFLRALED